MNVSGRQLLQPDFPETVAAVLAASDVPPESLTLEITESMLMKDSDSSFETLTALKALGVRISIDDFGTGYSSLGYLRHMPVDDIKIDRSFTARLAEDPQTTAIVAAIVQLAHTLGIEVVAEGVETHEQLAVLRRLGVDHAQGYLFGRPVPADVCTLDVTT